MSDELRGVQESSRVACEAVSEIEEDVETTVPPGLLTACRQAVCVCVCECVCV